MKNLRDIPYTNKHPIYDRIIPICGVCGDMMEIVYTLPIVSNSQTVVCHRCDIKADVLIDRKVNP